MRSSVAQRAPVPTLMFSVLAYRENELWIARSVLTGHIGEGRSYETAFRSLTRSIDACITVAERYGQSAIDWYEAQEMDRTEHVKLFLELVAAQARVPQEETAPSGKYVRKTTVVRSQAA